MFSYEPLSMIISKRMSQESLDSDQTEMMQLLLSMINKSAIFYLTDKLMIKDVIDLMESTAESINHKAMAFYLSQLSHHLQSPLSCALWFGLECCQKGIQSASLEKDYQNFRQQSFTHIGILYLYIRLFGEYTPSDCMDFLDAIKESMIERDASLLNADELLAIKAKMSGLIESLIYEHAAKGQVSFAKLLYEVSFRLFDVFDLVEKQIAQMCHFHEMRSLENEKPPCSHYSSRDSHWYYHTLKDDEVLSDNDSSVNENREKRENIENKEEAIETQQTQSLVAILPANQGYVFSQAVKPIMDELLENFDLLYLCKGQLHKDDTVDFVEFLNEVLVCDVIDDVNRVDLIKSRANAWYRRMACHYQDCGEDIIV